MWQHEADIVIVGYGGAGAAAAIAAAEAGAQVLVIEKNPDGGGNTRYSGGSMRTYIDIQKATDYIEALCDGATERDVIETFVREASLNSEWVRGLGGQVERLDIPPQMFPNSPIVAFPHTRGADGIGPRARVKGAKLGAGIDLWGILQRNMAKPNIKIECSLPAKRLLMDKEEGVTGVIAEKDGKEVRIRARKAVILTCGGFEYDTGMHLNYLGQRYFGMCNPGNTGDGIRMAGAVGADMWHMNAVAACFGYKFPEFICAVRQSMPSAGFIYVDQFGQRFMDETGTDAHLMWAPTSYVDTKSLQWTRIPCYVIFDDDTRARGPIGQTGHGKISDFYQWSPDNSAEVKKGWIKAGATPGDLAMQIGLRPEQLQATVARYNLDCVAGYDPVFGRKPDHLVPLGRAPYYGIELWPSLFNTQGGPKRNARAQVLDMFGQPIKRLYSAGELGSLWNRNYPGAGNVSEALAYGRIAGRNGAAEQPVRA